MTKAAVGTHSELLAAASPCRQTSHESKEPMAYPWGSGQVLTWEAGQEMCHLPTGCCRDCGTHRATALPPFLVVAGSHSVRALSFTLRPKRPLGRSTGRQGLTAAGLGWVQLTPCLEGQRWEMQ